MAAPRLAKKIAIPQDLAGQVLLHLDDPRALAPWLSWRVWWEAMKLPQQEGAGKLFFSHYDQLIQSALQGQGVALGRSPLVHEAVKAGRVVPLFGKAAMSDRAYFLAVSSGAEARPEVKAFADWVREQAKQETD